MAYAEHGEGGYERGDLQVGDEPAVHQAGQEADDEGRDAADEDGKSGIQAHRRESLDELDGDYRGESEDEANGEVDAPGHDDEELGHCKEKYQHAVE